MLNSVSVIGNLGQDPDLRYTQQGLAVANLNIAVSEHFRDGNGDAQKRTHWFRATAFGRTAEIAGEYLRKGSKVGISGQLVQRTWQDDQGNNRSAVEIRVNQLELIGGNGNSNQQYGDTQEPPRQQSQPQQSAHPRQQGNQTTQGPPGPDPPFDPGLDIPF
jgi:single-strand DNA-binding protein